MVVRVMTDGNFSSSIQYVSLFSLKIAVKIMADFIFSVTCCKSKGRGFTSSSTARVKLGQVLSIVTCNSESTQR